VTGPGGEGVPGRNGGRGDGQQKEPESRDEDLPSGLVKAFGGSIKQSARAMDAAYGLVGAILGLGFIGWLLDRYFGTAPAWLLVGLLLGVVIGLYGLARVALGRPR
jgi:F0F1-type ATP synthase assembly protein I